MTSARRSAPALQRPNYRLLTCADAVSEERVHPKANVS
jgi:hypothetical protein